MKLKRNVVLLLLIVLVVCVGILCACDKECKHLRTYDQVTQQPTCTQNGSKNVVCKDCSQVIEQDVVINAVGHSQTTTEVITQQATCSQEGSKNILCSVCDQVVESVIIAKTEHSSVTTERIAQQPTCTKKGTKEIVCSVCDQVVDSVELDKLPHQYGDWTVDLQPTATYQGQRTHVCVVCQTPNSEIIPILSQDDYSYQVTLPTCKDKGIATYTSAEYGTFTVELPKSSTHGTTHDNVLVQSTCYQAGSKQIVCDLCSQVLSTETIPQKSHSFQNTAWTLTTNPTLDSVGVAQRKCDNCNHLQVKNDVEILSNTAVWTKDANHAEHIDATHTTQGKDVYLSVYGKVVVTVEKLSQHVYDNTAWTLTTNPTLDSVGVAQRTCICGDIQIKNDIAVLTDTTVWTKDVQHTDYKQASCTLDGVDVYTSIYGVAKVPTPKLGHLPSDTPIIETPASCTTDGEQKYICSRCQETLSTQVVPATGHTFNADKDGYCKTCDENYYTTGLIYELSEDGSYYIIPNGQHTLVSNNGEVVIPAYYNGLPVKEIAGEAFTAKSWIKQVTIPETVEVIGAGAFNGTALTDIYFNAINCQDFNGRNWVFIQDKTKGYEITLHVGAKVEHLPNRMFFPLATEPNYVPNVTNVVFEEGSVLKSIGDYAFYLTNLKSIVLPDSVTTVGNYAFAYTTLESVTLGQSVATLGDNAFMGCTELVSLTLNCNLEQIGKDCFNNCKKLVSVDMSQTKVVELSVDSFKLCSSLQTIQLPQNLQIVGNSTFENCSALQSISLPQSVTYIGKDAFMNCSNITEITIPQNVTFIGSGSFQSCTSLATINFNAVNCADFEQGNMTFANVSSQGITLNIGQNVQRIPARLLYCNADVTQIPQVNQLNVSASVKEIGDYAFMAVEIASATYQGDQQAWSKVVIGLENADALKNIVIGGNA